MRREFIKELRGESRKEAIDIYDRIDLKELKEAYLASGMMNPCRQRWVVKHDLNRF